MSLVDTHDFPCPERPSVPGSARVVAGGAVSLNQCTSTRVFVSVQTTLGYPLHRQCLGRVDMCGHTLSRIVGWIIWLH